MSKCLNVVRLAVLSPGPPCCLVTQLCPSLSLSSPPGIIIPVMRRGRAFLSHPPNPCTCGIAVNPPNSPESRVLLFYRCEAWSSRGLSAHLIWTSWQGAELGFDLGKSGTKANVLGYGMRLPSGRKDAHLHPAPGTVHSRCSVDTACGRRSEGWMAVGFIGAPGILHTPVHYYHCYCCYFYYQLLSLRSWRSRSVLRVRSGFATSVAEIGELAIFVLLEPGLRLGPQAACVMRLEPQVPCKPSCRAENWGLGPVPTEQLANGVESFRQIS